MNYLSSLMWKNRLSTDWISRYKVRGFVETNHNGGRPPKTSKATDRRLVRFVKKHPFATARDVIKE